MKYLHIVEKKYIHLTFYRVVSDPITSEILLSENLFCNGVHASVSEKNTVFTYLSLFLPSLSLSLFLPFPFNKIPFLSLTLIFRRKIWGLTFSSIFRIKMLLSVVFFLFQSVNQVILSGDKLL